MRRKDNPERKLLLVPEMPYWLVPCTIFSSFPHEQTEKLKKLIDNVIK